MFKKFLKSTLLIIGLSAFVSSCTSVNKAMREPNSRVEFKKDDFTFSGQLSAEATSTKILGIDFKRLFNVQTGTVNQDGMMALPINIASIPVIGNLAFDKTGNYALYELMKANQGYDVVFYPQYETTVKRPIGLGIYKITTVKVTAKLAKIK